MAAKNKRTLLRPDLHLTINKERSFLADTKYKLLYDGFKIAPADLYQMTAYAIRHKSDRIHLFYPRWKGITDISHELSIKDEFVEPKHQIIQIQSHALQVQEQDILGEGKIERLFVGLKNRLREQLEVLCI